MKRLGAALVAMAALYLLATFAHRRIAETRRSWPRLETRLIVPRPDVGRVLSLGYNEAVADWFWAKLLVHYGDGLAKGWTLADVEPLVELVNTLDPWFRRPYVWGGYATTYRQKIPTQEEFRSSIEILERGLERFPCDWEMHWVLGLRYYMDLRVDDPDEQRRLKELGADHIERAMRCPGADPRLPITAAAFRTQLGQKDRALKELREMILHTEDPKARETLMQRYQGLLGGMDAALEEADRQFRAEWRSEMPYASPSLYVLVGPRPPAAFELERMAEGERFEVEVRETEDEEGPGASLP